VLNNPENVAGIADLIHSLYQQPELCRTVGSNAASTAKSYTWERNAGETWSFLLSALQRKDIEASHPFVERVLSQGPMVAIGRALYSLYYGIGRSSPSSITGCFCLPRQCELEVRCY